MSAGPYDNAWIGGDFDAAVSLNSGYYDPYLMYGRYFGADGSLSVPAGLSSITLSDLLGTANATTAATTRQSTYRQLQEQLLTESPWAWTFRSDNYYLVSSSVTGFVARPDGLLTSLATTTP
jgi:ABC-type transport system substrate-binding protein